MLISLCLLLVAQDAEAVVRDFESKLHKIKEEERIPLVREFFAGLKESASKIEALGMLDQRYVGVIPSGLTTELLRPLLKDADAAVRVRAAGAAAYTGAGGNLVEELTALLAEASTESKVAALAAMGQSDHEAFAAPLRAHLKGGDAVVRRAAVRAHGNWVLRQTWALLPMLKDPDAEVRTAAAEHFGRAGSVWAADELGRLLTDPERAVRLAAIRSLSMLGKRADLIRKQLDDADGAIRATAAMALGEIGAREHLDAVAALLTSDDRQVRAAAVSAVAMFRDVSVLRRLAPLRNDPDAWFARQSKDELRMWATRIDAGDLRRHLEGLVKKLGAEDVEERDAAERDLVAMGWRAIDPLKAAAGNAELTARARAAIEEIRWGEPMRALQKKLDEANASTVRTFELVDTTSEATKRWFPEVRVMTLRCSWQKPELSSLVWPRSYLLDPGWDEPYEGDAGVSRLLERYAVKVGTAEEAKEFVAFLGSLGIPGGVPQRDTLEVRKTNEGYEARRSFGKVADVYTLRVDNGQLRGVAYERK